MAPRSDSCGRISSVRAALTRGHPDSRDHQRELSPDLGRTVESCPRPSARSLPAPRSGRAPPSAESRRGEGRCHNYRTDLGSSARSRSGGTIDGIRCARRSGASSQGERTGPPARELISLRMLRGKTQGSPARSTGLPRRQPNSQRRHLPGGPTPGSPTACCGRHRQDGRGGRLRARPPGVGLRRRRSPPRRHLLPQGVEPRPGRHRGRAIRPAAGFPSRPARPISW